MLRRRLFTALVNMRPFLKERHLSSELSEDEYEKLANETLNKLADYLDSFPDRFSCDRDYDVNSSMGVVTAKIGRKAGTYVINKQTPNRQIWLSSPLSGPKRFDLVDQKWICTRDNISLDILLNNEFRKIFETEKIDFSICL
ncbi:Frataxin-like domain containing protein [Brugia malayi]|uniref:ferroxidase n=2 Tax=Brugia malayi TaxID=6279 RepID=A0A4E9FRL8_BRUMA|nr:Frataxin-like domain containing protein [Brugia malayi]VIO97240.1 Frataxin-like domain containing protein [Brugia malayi]